MDDLLFQLPNELIEEHVLRFVGLSSLWSVFSVNRSSIKIRDNLWFWKRRLRRVNDDRLQELLLDAARHNNWFLLNIVHKIGRFVDLDLRTLLLSYYNYLEMRNIAAMVFIKKNYSEACSTTSPSETSVISPSDWQNCFFDDNRGSNEELCIQRVEAVQRMMKEAENSRNCGMSFVSSILSLYRLLNNPLPNIRLYYSFLGRSLSRSVTIDNLWLFFYLDRRSALIEDSTWHCDGVDLKQIDEDTDLLNNEDSELLETIGHSICKGLVERVSVCRNIDRSKAVRLKILIRRFAFSFTYRQSITSKSTRSLLNWLGLSRLAPCCGSFSDRRFWNREWKSLQTNTDREIGQWLLTSSYSVLSPKETIRYAKALDHLHIGAIVFVDEWVVYHAQAEGHTRWVTRYCELRSLSSTTE